MTRDSATAWLRRLDRYRAKALRDATPAAFKVFTAIEAHAGVDGYAWPAAATIQAATGIRKRDSVYYAVNELEQLGVLFHRQLVDRQTGRIACSLYRIGAKVEAIPARCRMDVVLKSPRAKARPYPAKRGTGPCPVKRGGDNPAKRGTDHTPSNGAENSSSKRNFSKGEGAVATHAGSVSIGVFGFEGQTPNTETSKTDNTDSVPCAGQQEPLEPRSPSGKLAPDPPENDADKTNRFLESTCRAFPEVPPQFVELVFSRVYVRAGEWNSEPDRAAYYITGVRKLLADSAKKRALCEEWRGAKIEFFLRRLARDYATDVQTLDILRMQIDELLPRPEPADVDAEAFLRQFRARYPPVADGAGGRR